MKKIVVTVFTALFLGLAVVALGACGGGSSNSIGGGLSDENQIRAKIDLENQAFRSEDWNAIYEMASPADKAVCKKSDFVDHYSSVSLPEGRSYSKLGARVTGVQVTGDTASVSYYTTYDGVDSGSSNTEVWLKEDGTWYGEGDGSSPTDCGF